MWKEEKRQEEADHIEMLAIYGRHNGEPWNAWPLRVDALTESDFRAGPGELKDIEEDTIMWSYSLKR